MKNVKKLLYMSIFLILVCIFAFMYINTIVQNQSAKLSQKADDDSINSVLLQANDSEILSQIKIDELRNKYPICYGTPQNIMMRIPTFQDILNSVDTFVYANVVSEINHYNEKISTGYKELDDKRIQNGISDISRFFEYTLEVIGDTESKIDSDTQFITIFSNSIFEEYYPVLKQDMRIVVPVKKTDENKYSFMKYGLYYVTDDDYVLSAYEESEETKLSGVKINILLNLLKKEINTSLE